MQHLTMKESNFELAKRIEGFHTVETLEKSLNATRSKIIYLLYRLRKSGYVITKRNSKGKRFYRISPRYAAGGMSYIDVLDKNTPIKMVSSQVYEIHGKEPSIEETLIYFINKRDIRYIISSLALFRKVRNWSELYHLSKEKNLLREIGALYDVARKILPKLKKMPARFRNFALPKNDAKYKYIVEGFSSNDFKDIEKKWRIYIPLNFVDLSDYKKR